MAKPSKSTGPAEPPAPDRPAAAPRPADRSSRREARRAARLAAVQALYQLDMSDNTPTAVVGEFVQHRLEDNADRGLFSDLVHGVVDRLVQIDEMIGGALVEGWSVERLETVLRAIMRAGTYEILARTDIPPKVAITEYVDIAHAFYGGKEPGLVNAVLNRLAHILRPVDLAAG